MTWVKKTLGPTSRAETLWLGTYPAGPAQDTLGSTVLKAQVFYLPLPPLSPVALVLSLPPCEAGPCLAVPLGAAPGGCACNAAGGGLGLLRAWHHLHGTSVWRSREASEAWDQCQTLPAAKGSVLRHTHTNATASGLCSEQRPVTVTNLISFSPVSLSQFQYFFFCKKCVVYLRIIMNSSLGTNPASPIPVAVSAVGARGDPS